MIYYKLQKAGNLEFGMLRRGEIFFASPDELNDAHECRPRIVFNGSAHLWGRLADLVLSEISHPFGLSNKWEPELKEYVYRSGSEFGKRLKAIARNKDIGLEELEAVLSDVLLTEAQSRLPATQAEQIKRGLNTFVARNLPNLIWEPTYIASLTTNCQNPTMWGHYAAAERGFAIVYEIDGASMAIKSELKLLHGVKKKPNGINEIGIYQEDSVQLQKVEYRKRLPKVNGFHRLVHQFHYSEAEHHYDVPLNSGSEASEKEERVLGLVKYSDWKYEREFRAFLPVYDRVLPDLRVLQIAPHQIRGIVLGAKMSERDRQRVLCCAVFFRTVAKRETDSLPPFVVFEARRHLQTYELQLRPAGALVIASHGLSSEIVDVAKLDGNEGESARKLVGSVCDNST